MSFKRFDPEDIVVSVESIASTVWSTATYGLTSFYSSSTQEAGLSGDYYLNVYQTASADSSAAVQFAIAYGEKDGLGSTRFNTAVSGKSPSSVIYGQYRSLVLGDEDSDFNFGGAASSKGIIVIAVDRARFKEKLIPGTLNLTLGDGSDNILLTDNSNMVSTVSYLDSGRVYDIISGSDGIAYDSGSGYTTGSYLAAYGKFLPDIGVLILNAQAIQNQLNMTFQTGSSVANGANNTLFFNLLKSGSLFELNSEETVSSNYIFVRARASEMNYSTNPSNITGSGELRHNVMVNNPQAYFTTVGLYNDDNECLAVAKSSVPFVKDFTKEALVRIKLSF